MSQSLYYFDTSALLKLVVHERESDKLQSWISQKTPLIATSEIARTEMMRATRRVNPDSALMVRKLIDSVIILAADTRVCELAGTLDPSILRSLDAIHLATALSCGEQLLAMVCYNVQLSQAAEHYGLPAIAPS